ncbi:hypothetical protein GCM10025734_73770 [Kitasatospora paranensis]|uniref:hypothetical protein n=1 Tax=Kitasatospora paranensis TaxID=258053 RepID=UPI0031E78F5B
MRLSKPLRRRSALAGLAVLTAATTFLTTAGSAVPASAAPAAKDVSYRGYHVKVPTAWPVIDLATHPATCVRLDHDAVYLGHPTDAGQATCPAHLIGRGNTLLLEPLDATARKLVDRHTAVAPAGKAAAPVLRGAGAPPARSGRPCPLPGSWPPLPTAPTPGQSRASSRTPTSTAPPRPSPPRPPSRSRRPPRPPRQSRRSPACSPARASTPAPPPPPPR